MRHASVEWHVGPGDYLQFIITDYYIFVLFKTG